MGRHKRYKAQDFTKDATALPERVFAPDTYYGPNGKETGTFSMSDATMTAGDLRAGKIGYNNEGKVLGSLISPFKNIKSKILLPEIDTVYYGGYSSPSYISISEYGNVFYGSMSGTIHLCMTTVSFNCLIGFCIDDVFYPSCVSKYDSSGLCISVQNPNLSCFLARINDHLLINRTVNNIDVNDYLNKHKVEVFYN